MIYKLVFLNPARWPTRSKVRVTQVNPIFFISQNNVVLIKQNSQRVLPGRPTFKLSLFFINTVQFQPRISRVLGRPVKPGFKIII